MVPVPNNSIEVYLQHPQQTSRYKRKAPNDLRDFLERIYWDCFNLSLPHIVMYRPYVKYVGIVPECVLSDCLLAPWYSDSSLTVYEWGIAREFYCLYSPEFDTRSDLQFFNPVIDK